MMMEREIAEYGRRNGFNELREYYKRSAWMTLKTILECKWLQRRGGLIVTADHGEMIGEGDTYGHSLNFPDSPVLRNIPWFERI
jgi:hypothetical protein